MRSTKHPLIVAIAVAMAGCSTARDEARGFRLARQGDMQRGKAAFVQFGCNECHEVTGASNLPSPTIQRVVLGGSVLKAPSDGYVVTAIINPAYHAAAYSAKSASAGRTPMPEFASRMTVQQLTDIVVYLKSRYALAPVAVPNEFP
jgi:mono/diheme cytochrome c family protein